MGVDVRRVDRGAVRGVEPRRLRIPTGDARELLLRAVVRLEGGPVGSEDELRGAHEVRRRDGGGVAAATSASAVGTAASAAAARVGGRAGGRRLRREVPGGGVLTPLVPSPAQHERTKLVLALVRGGGTRGRHQKGIPRRERPARRRRIGPRRDGGFPLLARVETPRGLRRHLFGTLLGLFQSLFDGDGAFDVHLLAVVFAQSRGERGAADAGERRLVPRRGVGGVASSRLLALRRGHDRALDLSVRLELDGILAERRRPELLVAPERERALERVLPPSQIGAVTLQATRHLLAPPLRAGQPSERLVIQTEELLPRALLL